MRGSRFHPARLTLAFAALLVGVLVLHYSGLWPHWPKPAEHLYEGVEVIAAACCLWRAFAYPRERKAWLAIGLGMVSFAAAELYYTIALEPRGADIPYPSLADALYLGLYPCCFVGLLLLARCRAGRLPWMLWVDGLIVAFGFAAVASALVYGRVLDSTGGDPLTVATNLAYPMSDVLLLGLVAGLLGVFGLRGWRAWSAVICGFALLGVADTIYLWRVASGSYEVGGVLDAAWPAGMVLVGAAAWQQPGRLDARAVADRGFLPIPLIAGLSATALLVLDHYHRLDQTAVWAAAACVLAVVVRLGGTFRAHGRMLRASRHEAAHDALTGLGNRRSLIAELERRLAHHEPEPAVLALFDLDGFKAYNDAFGHPAGDLLLQRLGARLAETSGRDAAFRMGGDEFCVLVPAGGGADLVGRAQRALSDSGEGFTVSASAGTVDLPGEARTVADALAIADRRMYAHKRGGRTSASNQSKDVLLRAVHERSPNLGLHGGEVAELAERTARRLGLEVDMVRAVRQGAELHDIGKLAVPDTILNKPGPLDEDEWAFMRRHTLVGEKILSAAPALLDVAKLVRASHERYDGAGYPDGLAGEEIPLGSRVIAVCDAWDAMVTDRPYRRAMSRAAALRELERCAGTQFDAAVVHAFSTVLTQPQRHLRRWPDPEILARVDSPPAPVKRDPLEALRAAFGTGDLRRLQFGWAATSVGSWAFMVVLAVYASDVGGASAVGLAALVRMLPAAFTAPVTSLLADRSSRRDVMVQATLVRSGCLALIAGAVAMDAPFALVLGLAAAFTIASTAIKPAQAALLPTLARAPEQLAAANAVLTGIDNAGFLVGAVIGGSLIAHTSAEPAFAVTAADCLLAGFLIHRIPHDPRPAHRDPLPGARLLREARSGLDTVAGDPKLRLIVGFLAATTFVEGAIDVLVVAAALELLDMGLGGVDWLNAAWGVGGLVGGAVALGVLRRGRLSLGLAAGCIMAGTALALIATWPHPPVAIVLLIVLGVGYARVEVAGLTLMQRLVSDEVLARVFGVVESTYVASTGLGAVVAPVGVAAFGIEGALVAVGACLPLLALATWTRLARFEATTEVPERQFALLRSLPLFAPLALATVENLASKLIPVTVAPGQEVIRQGDHGDRFYVIAEGQVTVECDGEPTRTEGPGEFFGEIALLRDVPRTATVHAMEPGLLYALERDTFVCGVTNNPRCVLAADDVIDARLGEAAPATTAP